MRKRVLEILLLLSVSGALVGCSELNETTEKEDNTGIFEELNKQAKEIYNMPSSIDSQSMYDYVDPETGVHYLIYSARGSDGWAGGMTPRLNADGSLMVDETVMQNNPQQGK